MWSKLSKKGRWALCITAAAILLGVVAVILLTGLYLPYRNAENTMDPNGVMTLTQQEDGKLLLQWPEGINADSYTLTVNRGEEKLYAYTTKSCEQILPALSGDEVTLTVLSSKSFGDKLRAGTHTLSATVDPDAPGVSDVQWEVRQETGEMDIRFHLQDADRCRMELLDGAGQVCHTQDLDKEETAVQFGQDGFPLPEHDIPYTVIFSASRETPNLVYYGTVCEEFTLDRQAFLGTELELTVEELGNNAYKLSWNETKGEGYLAEISSDGKSWETLTQIPKAGERIFTTDHLDIFKDYSFRVTAQDQEPILSNTETVTTGARAVYSTIWALQELEVYADPEKSQVLGKTNGDQAYCVLEETDGLFGIRFEGQTGYIDSNYCMINLPEYMGDLCLYKITNSYASWYMVHEYYIPEVTDTVIKGYENIKVGEESYMVPLLYPTAKKLVNAAFAAKEQGYKIKIYDSFRPREATLSIYDLTNAIIHNALPEETHIRLEIKEALIQKGQWPPKTETAPEETLPDETVPGETVPEVTEPEKPVVTYYMEMTDSGRYALSNFLAKGRSNHNFGIAMDMTLVSIKTGEEVQMQTMIHDLSWYSEVEKNNDMAKKLKNIMLGAGFGGLTSEWWHFQDNDSKAELTLEARQKGVSPECWMKDSTGWRYRTAKGTYYKSCTKTINGESYTFDKNGYVQA